MLAASAFCLTGLALAALLLGGAKGGAGRTAIATAALASPLLLLLCFWSTDGFGDFRLRLTGVTAGLSALETPLRVGGDARADDLVFQGLPHGLARLGRTGDGRPQWAVDLASSEAGGETGVVQVTTTRELKHFVGSRDLQPGDVLCLERCDAPGALSLRLRADRLGLERAGGAPAALPLFKLRPIHQYLRGTRLDGVRTWSPTQGIFPLRDYGTPWQGVTAGAQNPCGGRFLCLADGRTPVRSFIYNDGDTGSLRIMLLDPGARLLRHGVAIHETRVAPITLKQDLDIAELRFYTVSYGSPFLDLVESDRPTSRLMPRGAVKQQTDIDTVTLALPRPAVVEITRPDIDAAAALLGGGNAAIRINILGAARDNDQAVENPLHVEAVGGPLGRSIEGGLLLDQAGGFGRSGNSFALVGSNRAVELGEPFAMGARAPLREANFVLERLDAPSLMVVAAFLWALLLAQGQLVRWRENRMSMLIIAVAQWLLALRLLVGLESASLDPRLDFTEAGGANMIAYFVVPMLLAAATPSDRASRRMLWPAFVFCVAMWIGTGWLYGWTQAHALGAGALAVTAALCAPQWLIESLWRRRWLLLAAAIILLFLLWWLKGGTTLVYAVLLLALAGIVWHKRRALLGLPAWAWVILLFAVIGLRLFILLAFGIGERFGWSINVSIFYVPLLILAAAGLFYAARSFESRSRAFLLGLAWCALLLLALVGVPQLVGDRGAAIYAIPVLAMGIAIAWTMSDRARCAWLLGWGALPVLFLAFAIWVFGSEIYQNREWDRRLAIAIEDSQSSEPAIRAHAGERAAALLAEANEDRMDTLRILTAVAPDRVANAGTSEAESQRRVTSILAAYTERPLGRGYLARSDPGEIRNYQADDNLSAVHVMGPFGRVGAAVLLLVLGLLAWAGGRAETRDDWLALAGRLALWTVFATAAYMILANLQLVPFTGRNIYLIAALSKSDLLEGTALLLLALRGLGRGA